MFFQDRKAKNRIAQEYGWYQSNDEFHLVQTSRSGDAELNGNFIIFPRILFCQ
jgi:hypothetical protein